MHESEPIKVGDVVRLKSGGLQMTVCAIAETTGGIRIKCQWFESYGNGQRLTRRSFEPQVLERIDVEEPF